MFNFNTIVALTFFLGTSLGQPGMRGNRGNRGGRGPGGRGPGGRGPGGLFGPPRRSGDGFFANVPDEFAAELVCQEGEEGLLIWVA